MYLSNNNFALQSVNQVQTNCKGTKSSLDKC
jgi:hypothetical protein